MGRYCGLFYVKTKALPLGYFARFIFATSILSLVVGFILLSTTFNISKYPVLWAIPKFARSASQQLKIGGSKTKPKAHYVSTETLVRNASNDYPYNAGLKQNTSLKHEIVWFNKPNWINIGQFNTFLSLCPHKNCVMSTKTNHLQTSSAIVFTITQPLSLMYPPINSSVRNPDQAWIFFGLESPVHSSRIWYRHYSWHHQMNWSMSYRTDADIFFPYGLLVEKDNHKLQTLHEDDRLLPSGTTKQQEIHKDGLLVQKSNTKKQTTHGDGVYREMFFQKTSDVAWIVSNCAAPSARDTYVVEMRQAGLLQIDVFGSCTEHVFSNIHDLREKISNKYKFYLSFENSFCVDYVTEKFFRYYEWDLIPVVRGGADYKRLLPVGTYIDASDFPTPKALAEYLKKVGSSVEMFTKFMKTKAKYRVVHFYNNARSVCQLCEKLNNMDDNRKSYVDHVTYIHGDMCWIPDDYGYNIGVEAIVVIICLPATLSCCYFFLRCFRSYGSKK